ncbi:MAG: dihydropteroate synthase [Clostridium sp.]|nr:dihydropteroate synthase [Clostridium sp.]
MEPFELNIRGSLRRFDTPQVMGILNVTTDSFYAPSRNCSDKETASRARQIVGEGATIIDIGACSTRPGAEVVSAATEIERLRRALPVVRSEVGDDVLISVDTFRAEVAEVAVGELGADIINDISGSLIDPSMIQTVARLGSPYILTHMRGTPATMQSMTDYGTAGAPAGVVAELSERLALLRAAGVADIIVDPGFGFSKTVAQNYQLLARLPEIGRLLGALPLLAGLSRKTMFWKPLGLTPDDVLPATTAANTLALAGGAAILRVHDVAAARQAVEVYNMTVNAKQNP